ncbi:MAG: hypothetical protein ABL933_03290 [Methyloglobulus sp.]|nr:hypothetical protein [Methyloglobulus sp.]
MTCLAKGAFTEDRQLPMVGLFIFFQIEAIGELLIKRLTSVQEKSEQNSITVKVKTKKKEALICA